MKKSIFLIVLLVFVFIFTAEASERETAVLIEIDGTITAGQLTFLERQLETAVQEDIHLFIIQLNTPGGLVDVTFKINEAILNAPFPVVVYVAPTGAIAASAGAFIALSADITAMTPVSTIGAAQPLSISPDGVQEADDKTTKFLARHARSLAEEKGRPAHIASGFVEDNLTLTAGEALTEGIADLISPSLDDLLLQLDGMVIEKNHQTYTLSTADIIVDHRLMNRRESLQKWVSNPQIAFLILMLGIMGIYFGLSMPGTFVPEVLGALLLILGIYGIGLFDTNTAGIVFLLAGVGLIVAEVFTSGFGILGVGGIIGILAGALMLPHEPLMGIDWYGTFIRTVLGIVIGIAIILIFAIQRIIYTRKHPPSHAINLSTPQSGRVVEELKPEGIIKAHGELWSARSEDGSEIPVGTEVVVTRADSLKLWVKPKNNKEGGE